MQVVSRVGLVKLCFVFAACAGLVQFIVPAELDLQEVSLANETATTPAPKKEVCGAGLPAKER